MKEDIGCSNDFYFYVVFYKSRRLRDFCYFFRANA